MPTSLGQTHEVAVVMPSVVMHHVEHAHRADEPKSTSDELPGQGTISGVGRLWPFGHRGVQTKPDRGPNHIVVVELGVLVSSE